MPLPNPPKNSNVNENWLFDFSADNDTCLEFDGTDDYVSFGNVLDRYVSFTLEAWIKTDSYSSSSGTQIILERSQDGSTAAKNANWQIALSNNGLRCKYQYGSGSSVSNTVTTSAITANNWHHVAVLRDDSSDEMRFYVDGVKIGTVTTNVSNSPTAGTSGEVTIGANFEQNNEFSNRIAHARVWSTARSDYEIAHYYNRTVDSTDTNLEGYWKLDEGNSNTGTITNAQWSVAGFDEYIHSFGLSFTDTKVSDNFYYGSVTNRSMGIRDSISLEDGSSTTGNITIQSANFIIHGTEFYKLLFNGVNNYHNKTVRVFAQYNYEDTLSNCQQIFTGRLVDVQLNEDQSITMQINSYRPWDGISFPHKKDTKHNVYEPVVYGAFDYSDHVDASYGGLYPVPQIITEDSKIKTLMPRSYSSGDNNYLHHYMGQDYFLPIAGNSTEGGNEIEATAIEYGVNVLATPIDYYAKGYIVPQHGNDLFGKTELTDAIKAFTKTETGDWDLTDFAYYDHPGSSSGVHRYLQFMTLPAITENTKIRRIRLRHKVVHTDGSGSGQTYQCDFYKNGSSVSSNRIHDSSNDTTAITIGTGTTGSTETFGLQTVATAPTEINLDYIVDNGITPEAHKLQLFGVKILVSVRFYKADGSNNADDYSRLNKIKYFYSGGNGLVAPWDSGNIIHGHDAHRALLQTFANISSDDPTNWSALDTDRTRNTANDADIDTWKIRYWQLKPTGLKENLDKLAFEFCFNWKIDALGKLKYIHVLKKSEYDTQRANGDILNLTKNDISKLMIKTSGINNIATKWEIANQKHPAPESASESDVETIGRKSGYYKFSSIENSNRVKYNLGDTENVKAINLDYNIGDIPTTPNSDPNADWFSYTDNIIGDIKVLVQCDIVNPAKGCQIETGDVVTFTDMPIEMFGTNFSTSTYFMIIETKRSPGKTNITAREVG